MMRTALYDGDFKIGRLFWTSWVNLEGFLRFPAFASGPDDGIARGSVVAAGGSRGFFRFNRSFRLRLAWVDRGQLIGQSEGVFGFLNT